MAAITRVDASVLTGAALTFQNSTASDTLVGGQGVHLVVNNTSGATRTVTIATPETIRGLAVGDQTVSCPTGQIRVIPVPAYYNDSGSGQATITVDTPGPTCQYAAFQGSAA